MTPGLRIHKRASLRLIESTAVPDDMRSGIREIVSLVSEDHGKGHAKALMWQVCAEADRAGMVLLLEPKPFRQGLTQEQLERFYAGFGFVKVQSEPVVLMARQAEKPRLMPLMAREMLRRFEEQRAVDSVLTRDTTNG